MASNSISANISIPRVPSVTEIDGEEESFVILGQSPSSLMFNEEGNQILQDALESLNISEFVRGGSPKTGVDANAKVLYNGDLTKSANIDLSSLANGTQEKVCELVCIVNNRIAQY